MSDTNTPGEMDEWDALQAQIDAEADGLSGRKPTDAELKKAADEFLKKHKDDILSDDAEDLPAEESGSAADALRIQELEAELEEMTRELEALSTPGQ